MLGLVSVSTLGERGAGSAPDVKGVTAARCMLLPPLMMPAVVPGTRPDRDGTREFVGRTLARGPSG